MTGTGFGTTNVNVTTSITSSTSKNEAGCKLKACLK